MLQYRTYRTKHKKNPCFSTKEKKSQWFLRPRSTKDLKQDDISTKPNRKTALERRWSGISQTVNVRKTKKRNSCAALLKQQIDVKKKPVKEPDYIRVPKMEYEAIKNRVSAMERRISIELDTVKTFIETKNVNKKDEKSSLVKNVQTVYEQTLDQAEPMSTTTDQLAKRLSKELKIRRSAEQKIIRSPSARKIQRRRSRELESSTRLSRNQTWHLGGPREGIPRASLRRGKPNTVKTGLPTSAQNDETKTSQTEVPSCNLSGSSTDTWVSAECFFSTLSTNDASAVSSNDSRASLAKLRCRNAGMVLAKAKLFDTLKDSDGSVTSGIAMRPIPRAKLANRQPSYKLSGTVKNEDRRLSRKSMSPRKRNAHLLQKQKIQMMKDGAFDGSLEKHSDKENNSLNKTGKNKSFSFKDCNRGPKISPNMCSTPRITPHIKRSLHVRSPKRLCRTPATVGVERNTPLRALRTPVRQF